MAKHCILLVLLFVGALGLPVSHDDGEGFDRDMSIFFDHTIKDANGRIVGGTVAAEGAYPWMAAISVGIFQGFICGGSIITARHVLTAAHCVENFGPPPGILNPTVRVRVGTNVWNTGGQSLSIGDFRVHPNYDWFMVSDDIGILITRTVIEMNSRVAPVALSTRFIPADVPARVSGFGRVVAGGPLSNSLMELRTTTVDGQRCIRELTEKSEAIGQPIPVLVPNAHICTFTAVSQGTCNGDSGSALVLDNNQQIGIVSWGLPCALGAPDVFVRVSAYISWINSAIQSS